MKSMQKHKFMRSNYTLRELKKKSDNYYRNIGNITPTSYNTKKLRYIVERAYQSLPKKDKVFVSQNNQIEVDRLIDIVTHSIIYNSGPDIEYNPREMFKGYIKGQKIMSDYSSKKYLWNRFKDEDHPLYNKYNTYVYRLGYSARDYFFNNIDFKKDGSILYGTVNLPKKINGVKYDILYVEWNCSTEFLTAYME